MQKKTDKGNKPDNPEKIVLQMDVRTDGQTELNLKDPPKELGSKIRKMVG